MKDPLDLKFPDRLTIELKPFHKEGLEEIASRIPHRDDQELVQLVLSRGILAMMESELERVPVSPQEIARNMNAAKSRMNELTSRDASVLSGETTMKNSLAFPNRLNMMVGLMGKEDWAELHARDAEYDRETARMDRDLGLADFPDSERENHPGQIPLPHVERYIGLPVGEQLRQDLEDALSMQEGLSEEIFLASLLDLGLRTLHERPDALDPRKVKEDLRTWVKAAARQKFKAEWKALCTMVARGYR